MTTEVIIEKLLEGNPRAVARAITRVENGASNACGIDESGFSENRKRACYRHYGFAGSGKIFAR